MGQSQHLRAGELAPIAWYMRAVRLTISNTSQPHSQGFALALSSIYHIDELMEWVERFSPIDLKPQNSMRRGNNRTSERSPSELPVMIV